MGTVTFEKIDTTGYDGGYKKTRFYRETVDSLTADSTTTRTDSNLDYVPMYDGDTAPSITACTYRGYELYIDETDDSSPTEVQRFARVTTNSTATVADGYDVYVSAVSTAGIPLEDFTISFKNLHPTTQDFALVVVAEDETETIPGA